MDKIFLIEDHDEALRVWRRKKVKGLDLVHLDAHIDFGFHPAKPIERVFKEAKSVRELKKNLEVSLAYKHYEQDFDKQTDIGNYIYPAMAEGIVRNFYWVVPGGPSEFKKSIKIIKEIISNLIKQAHGEKRASLDVGRGLIRASLLNREIVVCVLDTLPALKRDVLLDIDVDFLVIDSLGNAANTVNVGKRRPWILPRDLVETLKGRIRSPYLITIAYSVNGGWTPIKYKHFGDELAYHFAPDKFRKRFHKNSQAAEYFSLFKTTGKRKHYRRAVRRNPTYRVFDNNYGPLYLARGQWTLAKNEFSKILQADPGNFASRLGLGKIALQKRDFKKAKRHFSLALSSRNHGLFTKMKRQGLLGLAEVEFNLKNLDQAKKLLWRHQALAPLESRGYYFLGRIFEKERDFERSAGFYKDSIRLGSNAIEPLSRLLGISSHLGDKEVIDKYITAKYREFKRGIARTKGQASKNRRKIKGLHRIEQKMAALEVVLKNRFPSQEKGCYIMPS